MKQSSKKALSYFLQASKEGSTDASFACGHLYARTQNFRKAIEFFNKAADQGSIEALNALGLMHEKGQGVKQSFKQAVKYYYKAAREGHEDAQYSLGSIYYEGLGIKQNYKEAIKWFKIAAEKNNLPSLCALAQVYLTGKGAKKSYEKAFGWLKLAADMKNAEATHNLGVMYYEGLGTDRSFERARNFFIKAASQGSAASLHALGIIYEKGQGVKQSFKQAARYYYKATKKQSTIAHYELGKLYEKGQGVLKNAFKARKWFQKFINLIDKNSPEKTKFLDQYNFAKKRLNYYQKERAHNIFSNNFKLQFLGLLCILNHSKTLCNKEKDKLARNFLEQIIHINKLKSLDFYQVSALKKNPTAQVMLGFFYRYGCGLFRDSDQSLEWLAEASQRGFFIAQMHLAFEFEERFGVESEKYQQWFYRAGQEYDEPTVQTSDQKRDKLIDSWKSGDLQAAAQLGQLYADLFIVRAPQTTDVDVFEWLLKAVELEGDIRAQYRLGRMYQYGWGTVKNTDAAFEYFQAGAQKGHLLSYKALGELYLANGATGSLDEALKWYKRAAKQGDKGSTAMLREISRKHESPEAVYLLARAHDEGWGIAKDREEALSLYKRAAKARYVKAQYRLALKYVENPEFLDGSLDPLDLLSNLAGQEARKNYFKLTGQKLDRKARKNLRNLSKKGYYKAQHKLADLYAKGQVFPLNSVKDQKNSYQEAVRLYEESAKAISQGKSLSLTPLDQVREELKKLNSISSEESFNLDHPGFQDFLDRQGVAQKFDQEFIEALAPIFDAMQKHPQKDKFELILGQLVTFPARGKTKWATLTRIKGLLASKKTLGDDDFSLFSSHMKRLNPLWLELVDPEFIQKSAFKINKNMLQDPRIDLFNTCFRGFEGAYYKDTFENAAQKILWIFKKLHEPSFLGEAHKDEKGLTEDSQKLEYFLTQKKAPTNRFAHRLVRISDILQRKFERAQRKRDGDTLTALKLMLSHWAIRGVGDCRMGAEDELNKFYLESLMSSQGNDSEALTQEDWTLELQVAVSLSNLRLKLIDDLVLEKDQDRIHSVKYLEKKVRKPLALLGDTENYEDTLEKTSVALQYRQMSSHDITQAVLKRYTPDLIAEHLANTLQNPQKSDVKGKAISSATHEKLYRRLRFQFLRSQIAPDGDLDKTFFQDENYLLDHSTQKDFELYTRHKETLSKHPINWNVLKEQASHQAANIREKFYHEDFSFTKEGAMAILYSLGYLEVMKGEELSPIEFKAFFPKRITSMEDVQLPQKSSDLGVNFAHSMKELSLDSINLQGILDQEERFLTSSMNPSKVEEQKLFGKLSQARFTFKEHPVRGDGACGFYALGVDRARAVKQLLTHQKEPKFRNLLMPEIRSMFMAGTLPKKIQDEGQLLYAQYIGVIGVIDETVRNYNDQCFKGDEKARKGPEDLLAYLKEKEDPKARSLQKLLTDRDQLYTGEITKFCALSKTYEMFVKEHIGGTGWLGYVLGETGSMDALAEINQMNVHIWRRQGEMSDQLGLVHQVLPENARDAKHLLHTGHLTHYNLLEILEEEKFH